MELRSFAVCVLAIAFCGARPSRSAQEKAPDQAVEVQMKNVNFLLVRDIVLEIRKLRGRLQRTKPEVPVNLDESGSFTVEIASAEVALTPASLTALMNSYVLAYGGAPIKNVSVKIDGNRLM